MGRSLLGLLIVGLLLGGMVNADDAKDAAIKKDRQQIEGTWRIVALEVNGGKAMEQDARKLSVINRGDGTWTLRSEDKEVGKGTTTIDPTAKPKTIDISMKDEQGKTNLFLGIYELSEKTRKLCFAPAGKERPTDFTSPADSERILVLFERETTK